MNRTNNHIIRLSLTVMLMALVVFTLWRDNVATAQQADAPAAITVGRLLVSTEPDPCFNDDFLTLLDRNSNLNVYRTLHQLRFDDAWHTYPLLFIAGNASFEFTASQIVQLRDYLERGGILVLSSRCTSEAFNRAGVRAIEQIIEPWGAALQPLEPPHPLFETLFDIDQIKTVHAAEYPLRAVEYEGRLRILFSPLGLNDAKNLGAECCCCGANEILNARLINANLVVYALLY